jgi:hypothetical protein
MWFRSDMKWFAAHKPCNSGGRAKSFNYVGALGLAFAVTGCSIHPLPEDVAGVPTYVIVRQIRCETRQAIIENAIGWLTADQNQIEHKVDPVSRAIGLEFQNGRPIQQFNPKLFKGEVRNIIAVFYDAGVAYTFDLDMSETNNLDPQIDLLDPLRRGKFTMGIKAGFDRKRENERLFTVSDSFSGLIHLPDDYCTDPVAARSYVVSENYNYPIAGRIGVKRMIQDFIELTLFGSLAGPASNTKGPPTLVDQLSFTTELSGSVSPTVTFTPLASGLQVADASLNASVDRKDLHKVTMGLAIAGPGVKLFGPLRQTLFKTSLVTAHASTLGEQNAVDAVNQFLTLKLFQPTVVVLPGGLL